MTDAPADKDIAHALLSLAEARGARGSFRPSEVARAVAEDWRALMPSVRRVAATLPLLATQKGRAVDVENARGTIRLRLDRRGARVGLCDTPLGAVWLRGEDGALTALGWGPRPDLPPAGADDALIATGLAALRAYFEGTDIPRDLPLRPRAGGLTARVLDLLRAIPLGETRTYGALAAELGTPAQAVGQACGANPLPLLIPCHRVLGAAGLGGYSAPGGVESKVWLLRHEGAGGLLL